MKIYFIPGLGADKRLFEKQKKLGVDFEVIEWVPPLANERLKDYALRLAEKIRDKENFILLGVSLGGIVAQEIARVYPPKKLILISTVKSHHEIPFYLRLMQAIPFYKIFPAETLKSMGKLARRILGGTNNIEGKQMREMIEDANPKFVKWAIHEVIHWRFDFTCINSVHLHGTSDILFPKFFIKKAKFLKGGSHIMIFTMAEEVNVFIANELKKNIDLI